MSSEDNSKLSKFDYDEESQLYRIIDEDNGIIPSSLVSEKVMILHSNNMTIDTNFRQSLVGDKSRNGSINSNNTV